MDSALVMADWAQRIEQAYLEDGDRLWRALHAWSGDADIASDAMSEAFAQALRRGADVRDPAAWVWRSAFRIAAGQLRARRDVPSADGHAPGREPEHLDRYQDADLLAALRRLPDAQ